MMPGDDDGLTMRALYAEIDAEAAILREQGMLAQKAWNTATIRVVQAIDAAMVIWHTERTVQ